MSNQNRKFLDPDHPMFRRAWVRWVVSVLPMIWGGFEMWFNQPFWGLMFLAAGGYAFWVLILNKR